MITQFYNDGYRLYVELTIGRRWAHVLEFGTVRKRRFDARDYGRNARNVNVKPRRLASKIDKRRKLYNQLGVNFSKTATRDAIKILKGA